jgi:hypothetical protein
MSLFSFSRLEQLEEEASASPGSVNGTASDAINNLDVSSDVKEEIQEIVSNAVAEVVETIEEGESASDAVEETSTQLEETAEASEHLLALYFNIKKYGITEPVMMLCDNNGSFRQACRRQNSSVSFESMSVAPMFGLEQRIALETIGDSLKSAKDAVVKFLKKIWNFIKGLFSKFIDLFRNYEGILKGLKEDIENLKDRKIDNDLLTGTVSLSPSDYKEQIEVIVTLVKAMPDIIPTLKEDTNFATIKDKATLDQRLNHFASGIGGMYVDGSFKVKESLTVSRQEVAATAWKSTNVMDYFSVSLEVASGLQANKKIPKDVDELLEKAIKETEKLNPDPDTKKEGYVSPQTIASGINKGINFMLKRVYKESAFLLSQYIKIARMFINASKKIKD